MKNTPHLSAGSRTILCIGAHPDDCEFQCGGIAALWSHLGDHIIFLSITDGSSGTFDECVEHIRERRKREATQSVSIIHGESLSLGCVDGTLMPTLENRLKLIALIRKCEPDIILTNRPNDYHPDHRYTSQLVQDASYLLQVPNVVPEVPVLRYVPLIMYWGDSFRFPYPFNPDVIVNIDPAFDTKISMLCAHESQMYEWLPWVDSQLDQVPRKEEGAEARRAWTISLYKKEAIPSYAERYRNLLETRYGKEKAQDIVEAEAFEVCEYGFRIDKEKLKLVFKDI